MISTDDYVLYTSWHEQLLAADPVAPAVIAEHFLPHLFQFLQKQHPNLHEHLLHDAVDTAVFNYVINPTSFKPERGKNLRTYLQMSAEGDLSNALKRQRRYEARNSPLEVVELSPVAGNNILEEQFLARQAARQSLAEYAAQHQANGLSPLDQQLWNLMQQDEHRTEVFAAKLNITHLPINEQRRIVKRHKDRINLQVKRQKRAAAHQDREIVNG